jgi:hypothetical protein
VRLWFTWAALAAQTLISACVQPPELSPTPSATPGSFGALDTHYDRSQWRWVRNPDGRLLLSHTAVAKCFLDPQPVEDFNAPGFTVTREEKTIGGARYEIANVFEGRQFSEAIYRRSGAGTPLLGVYADGACRTEAERILQAYEKALDRQFGK